MRRETLIPSPQSPNFTSVFAQYSGISFASLGNAGMAIHQLKAGFFIFVIALACLQNSAFAGKVGEPELNGDLADELCSTALANLKARENIPPGTLDFEGPLRAQVRTLLNSPQQRVRAAAEKFIAALDSSNLGKVTLFLLLSEYAKSDHINDDFLEEALGYVSFVLTNSEVYNKMPARDQELALHTYEVLFEQHVLHHPNTLNQLFLTRQEELLDHHKLNIRKVRIAAATQAYIDLYNASSRDTFYGESSLEAMQIKDALYQVRTKWLPEVREMVSEEQKVFDKKLNDFYRESPIYYAGSAENIEDLSSNQKMETLREWFNDEWKDHDREDLAQFRVLESMESRIEEILKTLLKTGEIISKIAHQTPVEKENKVSSKIFQSVDQIRVLRISLQEVVNTLPSVSQLMIDFSKRPYVDQRGILNSLLLKWENFQDSWISTSDKLSEALESTTDLALKKQLILAFGEGNQMMKILADKILKIVSDKDFQIKAEELGFLDNVKTLSRKLKSVAPSMIGVRHQLLAEGLTHSPLTTGYQMMQTLEAFEKQGLVIQDIPTKDRDRLSKISNIQIFKQKLAPYVDSKLNTNVLALMRDLMGDALSLQKAFETASFEDLDSKTKSLKSKIEKLDEIEARLSQDLWYEPLNPELKWMKLRLIKRLRQTKAYIERTIIELEMPLDHEGSGQLLELQDLIYNSPEENPMNRMLMWSKNPKDLEERMRVIVESRIRNQNPKTLSESQLREAASASNARELSLLLLQFFSLDSNQSSED